MGACPNIRWEFPQSFKNSTKCSIYNLNMYFCDKLLLFWLQLFVFPFWGRGESYGFTLVPYACIWRPIGIYLVFGWSISQSTISKDTLYAFSLMAGFGLRPAGLHEAAPRRSRLSGLLRHCTTHYIHNRNQRSLHWNAVGRGEGVGICVNNGCVWLAFPGRPRSAPGTFE